MRIFLRPQQWLGGWTLVELMVTLAIIILLSVIAGVSLKSRVSVSTLESAVQSLESDVSEARSSALFKGCPTRFIFCADRNCSNRSVSVTNSNGNVIGANSSPVQYFGVLLMSQSVSSTGTCYNSSAVANTLDGYTYWDFDRRPQSIPLGVSFGAINGSVPDNTDWSDSTSPAAGNSLWFSGSTGNYTGPAVQDSTGNTILFQLNLSNCDPTGDSCVGYFVTMASGGTMNIRKCSPGGRGGQANSDNCF